jgi:hypothetical protein
VDPSKLFLILEMDAFNFALGVVLSQLIFFDILHLVDFVFVKNNCEMNCEIHDKKNLAIVNTFEEWYHLLGKAQHEIISI